MGFYELGNGCDSCESVSPILPQNVTMSMDPNSSMASGMMMPYNPSANAMKQYNGSVVAGYPQGNNMGSMGTGSTGGTLAGQPQAVKQVTTTVTTTSVPNAPTTTTNTPTQKVEGFTSNTSTTSTTTNMMMKSGKHWVILGLVVFCALAANECCKYFLNKSIQLDGSPMYYVAYVAVAVLLTYAVHTYVSNN